MDATWGSWGHVGMRTQRECRRHGDRIFGVGTVSVAGWPALAELPGTAWRRWPFRGGGGRDRQGLGASNGATEEYGSLVVP